MALLRNFSRAGFDSILAVHRALSHHFPTRVAHFDRAVAEVCFDPTLCPKGAAACVHHDRVVRFAMPPEHMSMAELGRVLLHEARHLGQDPLGGWYVIPHRCSDLLCRVNSERMADAVYRADDAELPHIIGALKAAGWKPHAPWTVPSSPTGWGAVLGFGLLAIGVGGLALAAAGGSKSWDANIGQYRDRKGRFAT